MNKYLSVFLVDFGTRSMYSVDDIIGVTMPANNEVALWYQGGMTLTFTLSGTFAGDNNAPVDYISDVIATAVAGENTLEEELVGITDLSGNATQILSVAIATA